MQHNSGANQLLQYSLQPLSLTLACPNGEIFQEQNLKIIPAERQSPINTTYLARAF